MSPDQWHTPTPPAPAPGMAPDTLAGAVDSLWDRMRSEERSDALAHVVEDSVRDARLADALSAPDGSPAAAE